MVLNNFIRIQNEPANWKIADQIRRPKDLALTSAAIHTVDLAAFTGFSQQFGLIIIQPLNLWEAPEHLYNRAGFCCGKFLKHTSDSLSKVKDLNLTPVNATLKASRVLKIFKVFKQYK